MLQFVRFPLAAAGWCWLVAGLLVVSAQAAGEPAENFLKRLRAAEYFDIAIALTSIRELIRN